MIISKTFTFSSAHKLEQHPGVCKNLHGHTYKLEVQVSGELDKNGIVIDFYELEKIVREKVISKLDHNYLNNIIENPTAEMLCKWIWNQLSALTLHKIKLWESGDSCAIYSGD